MTDRHRGATTTGGYRSPQEKTESDLSPRKTLLILVVVVGCFAVLWPKVFYPMLLGSANQHLKPSPIDKTTGCCDVISDTDVNTIKIMSQLCGTIIKSQEKPPSGKELVQLCKSEVLRTCGIDISAVLQEQVRLGQSVRQILDQVRSLNGSLCLKYNFGIAPGSLGVPHRLMLKAPSQSNLKQERHPYLRSEMIHPAFRERGRAIPQAQEITPSRPPPRIIEGRPGPVPGMRPTIGGAGHVVPPSKHQGSTSMSVIMPIYTIGIVIFFTYTLMKIVFKKQPEGVGSGLYPPIEPDPYFRREVFESDRSRMGSRLTKDNISSKLVVNAMSALLDEVDQEIEARRKSSEVASQDLVNGRLSNGEAAKTRGSEEQSKVTVLGMEMTASCEGGKKWSRPDSPVLPIPSPPSPVEPVAPPQEIYLEGALPAQSHLLVSDSATEPQPNLVDIEGEEDPAVVLAGKVTLSVVSLDSSENGADGKSDEAVELKEEIFAVEPVIKLDDLPVDELAEETVDEVIQEAIENIEQKNEPTFPQDESGLLKSLKLIDDTADVEPPKILQDLLEHEKEDDILEIQELQMEKTEAPVAGCTPDFSNNVNDVIEDEIQLKGNEVVNVEDNADLNKPAPSLESINSQILPAEINEDSQWIHSGDLSLEVEVVPKFEDQQSESVPKSVTAGDKFEMEVVLSDADDELGSDEEVVDEIEEITYESSGAGSEDEENSDVERRDIRTGRTANREEDKNGHQNISDAEASDNEEVEYEEEVIEVEEIEEEEDEDDDDERIEEVHPSKENTLNGNSSFQQ